MKLTVATCQFPIGSDIHRNLGYIARQIRAARDRGADVAHFPEACLSGYAGVDIASHESFDWALLEECARRVLDLARELRIWIVLGSAHRLTAPVRSSLLTQLRSSPKSRQNQRLRLIARPALSYELLPHPAS